MGMVIPPWSYTALSCFENCPKQYYHRYILKEKEPESEQMRHGVLVHRALEERVRDGVPIPQAYARFEPLAARVALTKGAPRVTVEVEKPFGVDETLAVCDFFSPKVWGRGKVDVVICKENTATILDWKTGKKRDNDSQLKIFAAFIFNAHPSVEVVYAANIWLEHGGPGQRFEYRDSHALWAEIVRRVNRIVTAAEKEAFDPKPSGLCAYCPVTSCPHNRR